MPTFRVGDHAVEAAGIYADPSIFQVFTLPFVQGNAQDAFSQLYSMVITESAARKFFGADAEKNVIGRQLRMDDKKQTEIPVSRSQTRRLRELFNL